MKYARVALLEACNTLKPALAAKDLIEQLTHVWFDGKTLTAYNDGAIGIQLPFETPFKGGLRGSLLLGLLANSKAKEVELLPTEDEHMQLVCGRTKAKLAMLDIEKTVWDFPPPKMKETFDVDAEFVAAMKAVMVSVGNDTSIPEKLGVTVAALDGLTMYTTDDKAVTKVVVEAPKGKWLKKGERITLPTVFCEQLLRICAAGGFMEIRKDCAIAGNGDGVLLYARLVDVPAPLALAETFEENAKVPAKQWLDIPAKLEGALDRALVVLEGAALGAPIVLTVTGGKLRIETNAEGRANMKDFMDFPGAREVELIVNPLVMKRALPHAKAMALLDHAVVFKGDYDFLCLVSLGGQ